MLNREDVAMLNNSLQNIGDSALRRRQLAAEQEMERQRMLLESQLRDIQQARYDQNSAFQNRLMEKQQEGNNLQLQRLDAMAARENAPKIQAYVSSADKPNEGMLYTGTYDQLQSILQHSQSTGHPLQVQPAPPAAVAGKGPVASYRLGGVTHTFYNQAQADNYENGLRAQGIDPYRARSGGGRGEETDYQYNPDGRPAKRVTRPIGADDQNPPMSPAPAPAPAGPSTNNPPPPAAAPLSLLAQPSVQSSAPAPASRSSLAPDLRDVQWLSTNATPSRIATFEGKYGQGSAAAILKGSQGGDE